MSELTKKILQFDEELSRMSKEAEVSNDAIESEAQKQADALMQEYEKRCAEIREKSKTEGMSESKVAKNTSGSDNAKLISKDERQTLAREIVLHIKTLICTSSS